MDPAPMPHVGKRKAAERRNPAAVQSTEVWSIMTSDNHESITWTPNPEVQARYELFVRENHGDVDIPRLCEVMWNSGGRRMFSASTEVAGLLPLLNSIERRIKRLIALYEHVAEAETRARAGRS